jgi:hypothetical protein
MAKLPISHHERVPGPSHRWHVHLHGRSRPVDVELPDDQRRSLDMTDDEIHDLLPSALQKHADENREGRPPGNDEDVTWDAPVRLMQTHFTG